MLPGSIFVHAKLIGADLTDANFSKVNLWNDLSGTDLSGTLLRTVFNSETKWPDGFDPIAVGAITNLLREIFCGPTKNWTCFLWTNLCENSLHILKMEEGFTAIWFGMFRGIEGAINIQLSMDWCSLTRR